MKTRYALLLSAAGIYTSGWLVKRLWKQKYSGQARRADENEAYLQLYYHWLLLEQSGGDFAACLRELDAREIAVYDLAPQGRRFIDAISRSADVTVKYAIERDNPGSVHQTLDVLRLHDDPLPDVNAVVVCTVGGFDGIRRELQREVNKGCRIVALEDLILRALELAGKQVRDGVMKELRIGTDK